MARITLHGVQLTFGGASLLESAQLHLEPGDRCCLVGRNGTGKSTLLKLIAREIVPDSGTLATSAEVAYLPQEFPQSFSGTALEIACPGAPRQPAGEQRRLEAERLLTELGVDQQLEAGRASGGELRRILLARVLSTKAEILLLDEPTNHLDIETILWLEEELIRLSRMEKRTVLFVTHDRAFAERVSTRVAELDRGRLYSYDCGYLEFISRQEERLANEEAVRRRFDQRVAEEEAWLAKGVKARRRRNEGRVRRLMEMRDQQRRRRERLGSANLSVEAGGRSGEIVAELEDVSFSYGDRPIISRLTTTVMRGDRVGIVGPNGSGKTTLLRLLLGELEPEEGRLRIGVGLETVYFDQMRLALDPAATIYESVGGGYDSVGAGGRRRHMYAYLKDFLFDEADSRKRVSTLSGGELNRLMLAKLLSLPANLLVLDEPTNDLDSDTLELLEELLLDFDGTILLVSHDRRFLDNVVTECLILTGDGGVEESVGTYSDWLEGRAGGKEQKKEEKNEERSSGRRGKPEEARSEKRANTRTYRETRELEELPGRIADLEARLEEVHDLLVDPELYQRGVLKGRTPAELTAEQERIQQEIDVAYERWELLESKGPS
ncbi:MAG: ATP-binding cassette domain-containing protein [Alkalispirochaetaceae bacterium]